MALEDELRKASLDLHGECAGIWLWGSHAKGRAHARSDVDVMLIAGAGRDPRAVQSAGWRLLHLPGRETDVRVFEDMPMYLQGAAMESHVLIWAKDEAALYEYLRPTWKVWNDQKHRQRVTADDIRRALARG